MWNFITNFWNTNQTILVATIAFLALVLTIWLVRKIASGGIAIVLSMLGLTTYFFAIGTKLETGKWFIPDPDLSFTTIAAFLAILYTIDAVARGFQKENLVAEDNFGLRVSYGFPWDTVSSGPPVLPRGLVQIRTETRKVRQREYPEEPQKIYRGEMKPNPENPDAPIIPEGMVPPVRITFGTSIIKAEAKELLGDYYEFETPDGRTVKFDADVPSDGLSTKRVTAEPTVFVRYRVRSDGMRDWVQNMGDFEDADRQIEDTVFAMISRFYTRMSVAQALHNFDWMNAALWRRLEEKTRGIEGKSTGWGIEIEDISMKLINFNHDLNQSIADAVQADFVAQKLARESEGEKVQITNRGEGEANAARMIERETLKGRASGVKDLAAKTGLNADDVYAGVVAPEIAKGPGTIWTPGLEHLMKGFRGIFRSDAP